MMNLFFQTLYMKEGQEKDQEIIMILIFISLYLQSKKYFKKYSSSKSNEETYQ